jgi:glycosyltransferase involved in cell wall biosynthesis
MPEKPLVTIGLPVYNSEKYLSQSIESLLGQTYEDFVLIISDNASTDGTAEICKSYAAQDSRIRYYRNAENIGNPRNFNRVFELTETPYLKWSTSDDWCAPTFVEKALKIMEDDPEIILCYPKTWVVDADGENEKPYEDNLHLVQDDPSERFRALFPRIGLAHQHLGLIRTSLARKTHLLRTHVASDINFLGEMALYGKIYELPERLFYRRMHPKSGSWKRKDASHQARFYHASKAGPERFKHWRSHYANFASVLSSPLSPAQKFSLVRWLIWRFMAGRRRLMQDVVDFGRSIFA